MLAIPDSDSLSGLETISERAGPGAGAAANESFWGHGFRYAAGLIIALAAVVLFLQDGANPLEAVVFNHIYSELNFLEDDSTLTLSDVNIVMAARTGREFQNSADMQNLKIHVTEDCWVDFENGVQGVHMVMDGNVGAVTVMVIPNTPVEEELEISDERFEGLISPTPGGNLVVVGEKAEAIRNYSTLLAANINW